MHFFCGVAYSLSRFVSRCLHVIEMFLLLLTWLWSGNNLMSNFTHVQVVASKFPLQSTHVWFIVLSESCLALPPLRTMASENRQESAMARQIPSSMTSHGKPSGEFFEAHHAPFKPRRPMRSTAMPAGARQASAKMVITAAFLEGRSR